MTSKEKLTHHINVWNNSNDLATNFAENDYSILLEENTDDGILIKLLVPSTELELGKTGYKGNAIHKDELTERAYADLLQNIFNMGISRMIKMESILKR